MANESTQWLYGKLTGLGYNVGKTQEEFDNLMQTNPESRKWAYETASACGLNVGKDINEFTSLVSDATTPVAPVPAQTPGQSQQTPATVQPVTASTAQNAAVKPTVETATQPQQPEGWTPTPMQQQAFQLQMDAANARMKKQNEEFEQRMAGMRKGNKPVAVMGEREINPQTGQLERAYYTTQGDRVATPMQQSQANTEYHTWWENNTEAGKRSKEQRLQREFDDRLASLWQRHNHSEGENAAELAWSAAESAYNSALGRNRQNTNRLVNSFAMNSTDAAAFKQMETVDNFTDRLTTHDLDALMDNAWGNLGEEGQRALIDDCYMMLRHRNPGVDELELYNQAKEFARQQSDLRMYHLAVEKNLPKSNLEYFMRKIGDMNLVTNIGKGIAVNREKKTGDMAAYEAANEEYRQDGHNILDVAGVVTGYALDPTTWLSAGVGGAATRGAMWAGGRFLAGRGASAAVAQAASRQFATSMTGRVIGGVVGGSVSLGTFEGIKEMENQFAHGGKVATMDEDGNLLQEGRYVNEGYSASAVGEQALHGLIMGAAIGWLGPVTGNVSDKLVIGGGKLFGKEMSGISNAYGKAATRAGLYAGATVLEGTIFSVPEWMDGNRDGFDVWTDNMAMMVGFKAKHMLKSVGGVLGDLKASFDSPTNGSKNRLDFESSLRMRMDAPSYGGLALTKDEEAELQRYGYDLRSLVESAERTGNAKEGTLIAQNAPEIVSRLTDMVTDPRVSEAARAKMYYYATGRKLPESTIMRGEMFEDGNGGFVVESQGANGVITSRSFKNRKAADLELERINHQAELNSIELGERYQQTADFESRLQDACRTVAEENGWDMVEVYRVCEEARRNHQRGGDKQFDEVQQNILRKVTDAMGEFEETGVTDAIRVRINEKYGVDIDAAIRKESNRRTQAEQRAIDEYIGELIPNKAKANPVMDAEAEDITNQKLLTEDATDNPLRPEEPVDPRFEDDYDFVGGEPYKPAEQPIGRAVMKYQDRQVEVLSGRVVLTDDGTMVDKERSDASIVIRDIATGKVEMVAPEAILSYENYAESPAEPDDVPQPSPEASVEPQPKYTSGQVKIRNSDGTETRGWLTGELDDEGKYEYYVEGDLNHLHYASEHELDNILSEYIPDKPQQTQEAQPTAPKPEDPNRPKPEGVANAEDYDEGYSLAMNKVQEFSDEKLTSAINELRNGAETLTDFGRGLLEGYEYEQQRRTLAAQPASDPNVGLNGSRHAFDEGAPGLPEVEYPSDSEVKGETDPRAVVPKNAENVPNIGENAEIPTENRDLGTESVPKPEDSVENVQQNADDGFIPIAPNIKPDENGNITVPAAEAPQQEPTPLQRIPRDEKGEPVFELAESPEVGWDALVEFSKGNTAKAQKIADIMTETKRKEYEKAQKLKPKGKTPSEILKSEEENEALLAKAENEYNLWQRIAGVEQSRQNAIRSQQEAEARRLATEHAEAGKAEHESEQLSYELSEEVNEFGKPYIKSSDGTIDFGVIDEESGLAPLPIRLSLGENYKDEKGDDHGYGYLHIEAGHRNEILQNGFSSVEEFVESVARNYTDIKEGAKIGENQTYLLEMSDEHNNTLFIQLSRDGKYWNVNSAGIFKKRYSRRKPKVYSRPAVGSGKGTDTTEVNSGQSEGATAPAGYSSETSDDKFNALSAEKQEIGEESSVQPSDNKGEQTVQSAVEAASAEVNTAPTPAQVEAGNYKKGHVTIGEFDITIENPAGSTRKGVDADGKEWSTTMANAYGYIKGTEGVDGDHIDVFLHQDMDSWNGRKVYVVDQTNTDGTFDEHKVMLGFNDKEEAMSAYLANYDATWAQTHPGIRISETNVEDFNKWVQSSHRKTKAFADYKSVRNITYNVDQTPTNVNEDGMLVDAEGKPLTLYHGTPNDVELTDLETGHTRAGGDEAARYNGDGISFTPNRDVADDYASQDGGKGKVFEVNVTLKKPYYTLGVANFTPEEAAEFTASLQAKGHDGIINYQSEAMREAGATPNEVIVFDIKSVTPATAVCPVCGKAEIPNYHSHDVVCPQCNSDLSVFRQLDQLSEEDKQKLSDKFKGEDNQGNPIDHAGNLIVEDVKSVEDITDEDFINPTRTVGLPALPTKVSEAIGAENRTPIIKKNIFDKNRDSHKDLTAEDGRKILKEVLYNPDLYGQNQKAKRPYNWILIHLAEKSSSVIIEVNPTKEHLEIVNWHYLSGRQLEQKKRQAEREGGRILTLSEDNAAGNTSQGLSSDRKVNTVSANKQTEGAESSEPYIITSAPYTNKQGKTLDTYLVTFDRDFSKEEKSALRAKAKAVKGWYDRERGGWMLRSAEDAKAFAEDVAGKSEDEVADEAPLSMSDMQKPTEAPVKKVDVGGVVDALKQKGETKLSDHAEPIEQPKPKKRRWISDEDADEFNSLRNDLRNHLGKGDDIVQESAEGYGKPQPKQMDAEVLRMGTRMTYLMMKGGLRSFADYCEAMKDELPDIFNEMRPHLKSLYAAAQNMEEVIGLGWDEEMDDRKTVKAFDVYNFDKPGAKDIIATAQHIVDERASQQQTDQIVKTLKDQRNEQRKDEADKTSADTEAIASKAEAYADEIESQLETATTEEDAERLSHSINKEIEEVNDQLALLGYYEADPVEKDFNEAYGYMRNAERKATQDAHSLATQLAADLGITIAPKDRVRKSKYGFGSKIARSNVAPAGGEVYISLPLTENRELSIWLRLEKNEPWLERGREDRYDEDLVLTGIMYRVENPNGGERYVTSNHNISPTATYDELLGAIRRLVRDYLPADVVKPAIPLAPQPDEDMVDMAERVARSKAPEKARIPDEQPMNDLFRGLFGEAGPKQDSAQFIKDMADMVERGESPFTVTPEVEAELTMQREAENNSTTQKNNAHETTDLQPRPEEAGRGRQQPGSDEPMGESAKHEDERTDGGRVAQRGGEHTVSDTKRGARVSGQHQSERSVAQPKNTRNNHAERGVDYAPKGEKARIDANLAAIRLAKELFAAGATATPEQMAVLRKYSGWGGLGSAFNEGEAWRPNPVNKQLREVLTPEEYEAAVMSRNSAYYTPAPIIDAMWDIARALGFKGGNIVEGSAGIGNIIGLMPAEISERSDIQAVEIDNTTGGILSLLYPDAKVEIQGFEATRIVNGSVDLAITNVPFVTGLHVMDESGDGDLSRKFRDIHDFCIAKNVRKLREGGIGIFITSSGTLDKSQKLRNWLTGDKEGCADVVGAFRLNNQTFGGTAATSDIIVVRKRVNGRKSANAIDVSTASPVRTASFTDVKGKTKDLPLLINRYFIEHPEHMGGEMFFGFEQGDTYRPTSIGLFPTRTADQPARIAAWVKQLAEMDWRTEAVGRKDETAAQINEALGEGVKEGSMITDREGNLCVARMGHAVPLALNKNKIKGRTKEECFKDYSEIKDALADALNYQTEHDDDAGLKPLLDRLNRAYDTFVQRYGNLNKNNNLAWLRNDVDFSSIVALETYSEKGTKDGSKVKTYGKTDIFSRRVVEKESEPAPKNVKDGIIASLYKFGRIDPEYLSEQLGKSREDVKREIIESGLGFEEPMTGQMEVSYEYLSGNVREKLRQAREANETSGGAYEANVKALEAVVPMNIPAHLIEFALGSSWLEPQLYEKFIKERTGLDVKLTNAGGTWHMNEPWNTDTDKNNQMGIRSESLGILIPGHKLIEAAITNKTITVSKTVKDNDGSHTETDPAATTACATKVDEIRQDFKDWAREQMQADPALSMRMEEKYNEKFNNSVPKSIPDEFVPEHFGGAATMVGGNPFRLRPHQAKAVIRATTQPVLLAHEVGTGKTYTLITTAMEMRRLGTARKPMIVVQNATVGQFVASAKALYPNAKVLTLEDADRNAEGRRAFYAKIKFNDWDMIVVPQSVFERIPDSVERQTQFIQDKIEEKMRVLEQMKDADPSGRSQIVKAAEREIARLENEITQLANGEPSDKKKEKDAKKAAITRQNAEVKARELLDRATDDVEDFDSMGIDAILVDEAHEYKHLGFATAMQRGVKGIDPSPSKKSQGVYLKAQAVLEKTGGKNVVFATGTPISNTAAEIWTFMRYLMPADVMRDYDIFYFDDFVRNFGNLQQMFEFKTNGKYEEVNRFAGYNNLPELVRIWSTIADTVLTREAGGVSDKIPQMEGDKAQDIFLPQTRALRSIMKFVREQLEAYEKMVGKEKSENRHVGVVMYGIAKAGAVDARLVQSDAEDEPNSKTNEAVRQTLRTLDETKEYKGTVAIFADNYQNKHSGFNLYEDIREKLIAAGVPEEQVVAMKSGMTVKKKLEIFNRVNTGEVRVVMGSTFTLGTGVNIQERLHTLIHLDAPNRPMDYTQRNGRILRQGNMHKEWGIPVRILRFGVEDSLDVTAYQRLKTKGAIADSIMNGKQLMANSMENRSLEEEQDLFGDITAQLSGSEYAMLKNQIEKEVRKLTAKYKAWKADQTYIHNRKRQIAGQNKEAEKRIADNKTYLAKVEAATIGDITVGKLSFPSMEAMEDFFTEQNKKKAEMQEQVRTSGYSSRPTTSDLVVSVGGFNFNIHTEISRATKQGQQGDLFYSAPAKMTYSCPELGIDAMPVKGNVIKNAVSIIMEDVVSGKDFRERIEAAERYVERNNAELQSMASRDGVPFQFTDELAKAEEKLVEYEGLMKKEMEAKEAKYAEMDKDVEAASNVELTEEDSEEATSEPDADYLAENATFVSRYETQDGKTIRYTSENPESYSGLSDTDYSGENRGSDADGSRTGSDILQRQRSATLAAPHGGRLNRKAGEFCNVERVFTESGSFRFTSGEKIESADDVAFIFSALEDAAVEHTFAVYVKDGVPTVVELGMGSFNASIANSGPAYLAYARIKPDEVYFVHNHPSGNLKCSAPDVRILKQFQEMCDVPVYGIIINLKTGKYGTFDTDNNMGVGDKRIPEKEYPLTLHKLDKQIFAPDYDPMTQTLVRGSQDVAAFVNSHRMGDRAKMSFLIISQSGGIVGNIHMPYKQVSPANVEKMAQYISERVIQFGGMSAIVYGDFSGENNRKSLQVLRERMKQLGGVNLLDVMRIEGNFTFSANDERILYEPDSGYGASPDGDIRFREVEDEAVLQEFTEGKTVQVYRTMQVIDGKLYSPMATKVSGKETPEIKLGKPEQSEEHPEIVKKTKFDKGGYEVGYIRLDKGLSKGTLDNIAYNPYIHTSRTVINDQFSSAYIRPNLVIVEVEIPESELTSGYRAAYAKNAVGEMTWHSGTVSGQLAEVGKPRMVILSRYDKPVRIVPFREVAAMIAEQLDGTDIAIPYNVVQPQLRAELERLGVAVSEEATGTVGEEPDFGKAEYITDQEIERINARQQEMAQTSAEAKSSHAERMSKKFNTPVRLVNDIKELTHSDAGVQARMRRSAGFYDVRSGEVVVVVPNNGSVEDVAATIFHEVVAHKGLREMIGEENYDAFCDEVYDHLKDDLKKQVDEETTRRFMNEPGKGYEHHRRVAVDELFGRMAEKGFEDFTRAERSIWGKLKAKVLEAINKFLGALKLPKWVKLGDNELRYMLWRSHERLRGNSDYVDMARDAAKREELGLRGNEAFRARKSPEAVTADKIERLFDTAVSGDLKGKPVEVGRLTNAGREYLERLSGLNMKEEVSFVLNPSDLVHIYRRHFGNNEKDSRNIPLTKEDIRNISKIISEPTHIVFGKENSGNQRSMFFFLKEANSGSYNLMEVYADKKGNLTAKSFFKSKEGVSQRAMLLNESSTLTSVTDGATLSSGAKLPKFFEYPTIADEESSEYRFRVGETGDIWKDQSVGLEERITNAAIRLSANQSGDLTLRNDAMRAIGGNLTSLRKAMAAQKIFDQATVKRVADLARILMQNGYLSGMTSGEMQRLISAVKNSVGHKEVKECVQKVMDIMVGNQLRNGEATLRQLLAIRGSKVDARGVEVQGAFDVEGQRTMEVVKKAMTLTGDDITDRIAEALNRMSDHDQTIADDAAIEYAGLHMALDYVQNIANSKAEEKTLRDELKRAKEDKDAGRMTDDAYKQYVETNEDAIRKNKIERAEAYFNLVGRLSDSLRGSIENAKAFREAEKERVNEIHHNANSDMEGRPSNEHHKDDWKDKFMNNGFVQFLFAPLGTFDQILRVMGNKSAGGEGYLWNRFMRGWVDCRNKELQGVKAKFAQLDEKAAELFGKGKTWGDLIRMEGKLPKAGVRFWDGGEMRDHELTQGNLLYIYMTDKMTDGRMKLRRMGITEDDITNIEQILDPRFKALGDWLQEEFLVGTRNEYNETHKRMFGASMAAIENYFPLKILANARIDKEEDVNQQNQPDGITTKTGSIIKRRVNNLALDITGADALSVILDHITQMEHWGAFAEWNRDLNTLRTYKRFRNQVINMTTVYGGGRKLWENFNDLCLMAAGEYRPPIAKLDKSAVNLAKGVTAAKVSFRMFTALKQLLSAPAYIPEVSVRAIANSIANPYGDFKWCLENMPIFRERWHSRISGDPRLLKSDMDWKMWRSRIMEISSRIGMTPNAFVDAVTVSIGARAMYETRLKQYLKEGYPADAAEKRAKQDAAILFNQTQQSSESPFLSTMQVDRSWLSVLYTVFRNSAMSYTRQEYDAMRNLKRNLTRGQRAKSVEFMTKQILRDWNIDPESATDDERSRANDAARKRFRRQIKKDVLRIATFGFILEALWNLGPYLPYIFFGNEDEEKDKMWDDALTHAYFGSVEGLTGGDVMSSFGNMAASGEWSWNQLSKDMPLASDINTIANKFIGGKNAEAINDILNLLVQSGIGMNPQSLTDAAIAITDACGDDTALSHEAAIFVMRVLQVPQSQLDKLYFDEIGLSGEEASKLTPEQLAARYAEYKVKRGTPLAPWSWDDEERLGKYEELAKDRMTERLESRADAAVNEAYADFEARYKAVSKKVKRAEALMKNEDYVKGSQAYSELHQDPDQYLYRSFKRYDEKLSKLSQRWLAAKTPEEASQIAAAIHAYRAEMVKTLQAETAESQ